MQIVLGLWKKKISHLVHFRCQLLQTTPGKPNPHGGFQSLISKKTSIKQLFLKLPFLPPLSPTLDFRPVHLPFPPQSYCVSATSELSQRSIRNKGRGCVGKVSALILVDSVFGKKSIPIARWIYSQTMETFGTTCRYRSYDKGGISFCLLNTPFAGLSCSQLELHFAYCFFFFFNNSSNLPAL